MPVPIGREPGGARYQHPHGFAERARQSWGRPTGPLSGLLSTLESNGIICLYRDLSPLRVHALASTAENGLVLLLLDSGAARAELAWAIAHELGHLVLTDEPSNTAEADADSFAVALLAPGRDVLNLDISTADDLISAATAYGVPPRELLKRLRTLRKVTAVGQRELAAEMRCAPPVEVAPGFLGSTGLLASAVGTLGGSDVAASRAFLTVDEVRTNYLAGSAV